MLLIAIGANLMTADGSPPIVTCRQALLDIAGLNLGPIYPSNWYETEPVPPSGQPPYINGVVGLDGESDPVALLRALQAIEARHDRQRSVPDAARTLDLDIIAMGALVRHAPDPVIPHPRMHGRAFVLRPLLDVVPDWQHPVLGRSARALLDDLPPQAIRLLGPSHLRENARSPN